MKQSILRTQPNLDLDIHTYERHMLPLPSCCPVSANPQSGSEIIVSYIPKGSFLEVYSLSAYINSFVGGHPDGVRDMEGMIQKIAHDCAEAIQVEVKVRAKIRLHDDTEMFLMVKAKP